MTTVRPSRGPDNGAIDANNTSSMYSKERWFADLTFDNDDCIEKSAIAAPTIDGGERHDKTIIPFLRVSSVKLTVTVTSVAIVEIPSHVHRKFDELPESIFAPDRVTNTDVLPVTKPMGGIIDNAKNSVLTINEPAGTKSWPFSAIATCIRPEEGDIRAGN